MKELLDQFFGQPAHIPDCAARCLWLCLAVRGKVACSYRQFLDGLNWLNWQRHGLFTVDVFRTLEYYGLGYRISIPEEKGFYLVAYSTEGFFSHFVLYVDGVLHNPQDQFPIKMGLPQLKEYVSSKVFPSLGFSITIVEVI